MYTRLPAQNSSIFVYMTTQEPYYPTVQVHHRPAYFSCLATNFTVRKRKESGVVGKTEYYGCKASLAPNSKGFLYL